MVERVSIRTMLDEESGMASAAVTLWGEGDAVLCLEGEERSVSLSMEGVRQDFYILSARVWQGTDGPELYTLELEEEKGRKECSFGFRNIGLDPRRGFFLSGRHHPLSCHNTIITGNEEDLVLSDKSGNVAAFVLEEADLERMDIASILNHPSLCFLSYIVGDETREEEMKRINSLLYALDKTRPTMGIFRREMRKGEENIFDVSLVPPSSCVKGRITATLDGEGFAL
ncbi:MAG: hypothetical protein ACI4S4_06120 [Candidatus Ornithospirochaeta sp.]